MIITVCPPGVPRSAHIDFAFVSHLQIAKLLLVLDGLTLVI